MPSSGGAQTAGSALEIPFPQRSGPCCIWKRVNKHPLHLVARGGTATGKSGSSSTSVRASPWDAASSSSSSNISPKRPRGARDPRKDAASSQKSNAAVATAESTKTLAVENVTKETEILRPSAFFQMPVTTNGLVEGGDKPFRTDQEVRKARFDAPRKKRIRVRKGQVPSATPSSQASETLGLHEAFQYSQQQMLFLKHKPAAPTELGIHGLRFRAGIEEQISGGNDEPTVANGLSPEEMAGQDIHFYDFSDPDKVREVEAAVLHLEKMLEGHRSIPESSEKAVPEIGDHVTGPEDYQKPRAQEEERARTLEAAASPVAEASWLARFTQQQQLFVSRKSSVSQSHEIFDGGLSNVVKAATLSMLEPQQPKMSAWVVKMERGAIKKKRLRIKKRQPGEESTLPAVEALRATDSDVVQLSQQQMIFAQGARGHISANNVNMFPKIRSNEIGSLLEATVNGIAVPENSKISLWVVNYGGGIYRKNRLRVRKRQAALQAPVSGQAEENKDLCPEEEQAPLESNMLHLSAQQKLFARQRRQEDIPSAAKERRGQDRTDIMLRVAKSGGGVSKMTRQRSLEVSVVATQAELSVVEAFGAGTDHGQEKVGELTAAAEAIKEKRLKLRETQMTLDGSSTLQAVHDGEDKQAISFIPAGVEQGKAEGEIAHKEVLKNQQLLVTSAPPVSEDLAAVGHHWSKAIDAADDAEAGKVQHHEVISRTTDVEKEQEASGNWPSVVNPTPDGAGTVDSRADGVSMAGTTEEGAPQDTPAFDFRKPETIGLGLVLFGQVVVEAFDGAVKAIAASVDQAMEQKGSDSGPLPGDKEDKSLLELFNFWKVS